jgi:hypothetical protein
VAQNITRCELRDLGENYEVIEPISVEIAALVGDSGTLYWATAVGIRNELVFGVGRTKLLAIEMLKELLTEYYVNLMSSDLDRCWNEDYWLDKQMLKRSVVRESTT